MASRARLGVDLGGTKIEAALIADDGTWLARRRLATPREDYEATLDAIASLVTLVEAEAGLPGPRPVGLAMPGALSPATGLVKNANSTWLNGRPFDRDLAARLGRPLRVANDANCLALSEAVDGAAAGARVVFGIIVGTGCGGGITIDGNPITGAHAIAGEWGHNPLPAPTAEEAPGRPCYCGRRGCIETFLSGPALVADATERTGLARDPAMIARAAAAGEAGARAAIDAWLDRFARALGSVVNLLDPDIVVVGGGLSNLDVLYEQLPERLPPYVFSDRVATPIRRARHGDSSGVRGAAWLWPIEA